MKKIYFLLLAFIINFNVNANTDKYRLTLRENPSTSIVIGWNQISGSSPRVYYGTTDHGTNYANYPNSTVPSRTSSYKGMNNNFVRLTGLQPNTSYYFVIKDSQGTSRRLWFKTAPSDNSRLSFIAGGDSRNNRTPRRNANLLVSKLKPHAVLFGGDMTNRDTNSEWQTWFDDWQLTIASDGRMFPIIAARGNHEGSNNSIYNLFDTPSSSVYYAITFGNNLVRAYTLNTEISISGNQTTWLQNDLSANANVIWKTAQYHRPIRPHARFKRENNTQYNSWANLFYNNNVKLVVECDSHMVKTTWPVKPSTASGNDEGYVRDDANGTVYIGEGCWGAPIRNNDDDKNWTRNSGAFNQFKWIFIDEDKIEARTIRVDNATNVESVSNTNVFQIPSNLDIWNPSKGSVVTINKNTSGGGDNGGGNSGSYTIEVAIENGSNDVEEGENGTIYVNSSDLEMVYDSYNSNGFQKIGLRFTGINLPKDATITNAYIQFTADESNSANAALEISLHNSSNSAAFSNSNNVSSRPAFSSKVTWNPSAWSSNQNGSGQRTPDLKNMVQDLANKSGWVSGNNASFIIKGKGVSLTNTSAKRVADSYEGGANKAPKLIITYTTDSDNGDGSSDICNGVAPWKSGVSYSVGSKVNYNGNLFQRTSSGWDFLGTCGTTTSRTSILSKTAYPPLITESNFDVYPNPFTNQINITIKNRYFNKPLLLQLFDTNGKQVHEEIFLVNNPSGKMISPNINASGIYILSVKQGEQLIKTQRIIKK